MRTHHISSRPHVQGNPAPLRLRHSAGELTDGAGLVLLRRLWDQLGFGRCLDEKGRGVPGVYRPSLLVEAWVALLLYGGRWLDDLALLRSRGVRRLFGWAEIPHPTTFGRFLRRAAGVLVPVLDDYLTKPFGVPELLARLRALLRPHNASATPEAQVRFGVIEVDLARHEVRKRGELVHLTPIEFRLLAALIRGRGRVLTYRQLLVKVWGPAYIERVHYLRVHMANLRQKLEDEPARPKHLVTELTVGYRLVGLE